jgi:hypothetical protein
MMLVFFKTLLLQVILICNKIDRTTVMNAQSGGGVLQSRQASGNRAFEFKKA